MEGNMEEQAKKGAPNMQVYLAMFMKTKSGEKSILESLAMFMKTSNLAYFLHILLKIK